MKNFSIILLILLFSGCNNKDGMLAKDGSLIVFYDKDTGCQISIKKDYGMMIIDPVSVKYGSLSKFKKLFPYIHYEFYDAQKNKIFKTRILSKFLEQLNDIPKSKLLTWFDDFHITKIGKLPSKIRKKIIEKINERQIKLKFERYCNHSCRP